MSIRISILYIHMFIILKDIDKNKEEEICLPNKESTSGYRYKILELLNL